MATEPITSLAWSASVGKRIRSGTLADQATSTATRIVEELQAAGDSAAGSGHREAAAQLVDYFVEEAKSIYLIYSDWLPTLSDWLVQQGIASSAVQEEVRRLQALVANPDGSAFDASVGWLDFTRQAGELAGRIRGLNLRIADAEDAVRTLCDVWRQVHDRYVDLVAGILAYVVRQLGEDSLDACYRVVLAPYFDERYRQLDLRHHDYADTLDRNLYLVFEGMRAHLVGPGRLGDVTFRELDDRWEFEFDPCGSGGRILRGDPIEGTGSRVLPPYEFGVTTEPHPWSWNETGVCYYCVHCNLALSTLPVERWGTPIRTVDPPLWRGEDAPETRRTCRWTVWRSPEAIPDREFERIGRSRSAQVPE